MQTYQTNATVQPNGQLDLGGVPFPPGTAVEVTITQRRLSAAEFLDRWREVTQLLRADLSAELDDATIRSEIDAYRARR
jgi:hypothetical protein